MPDSTHSIVIDRLSTRCHLLAGPDAAGRFRTTLDTALEQRLPEGLERAAEPVLDGLDGVVRIRQLDLRLDLGDTVEAGRITETLAQRIVAALHRALTGGLGQARVWPDHDTYIADYLAMRLGLRPQPAWPFADLATYEHLPAERAAAEMIRARPALLLPLARLAAATGAPEAVVAGWPQAAQAALATALLNCDPSPEELAALLPALDSLAPLPSPLPPESAQAVAAAALRLSLRVLADTPARLPPRAVLIAAAALLAATVQPPREPKAPGRRAVAAGDPSDHTALARARSLVTADPAGRARLARLLQETAAHPGSPPTQPEPEPEPEAEAEAKTARDDKNRQSDTDEGAALASPFAGLALLMPSVLALGAVEALGETGLAQAVWQTLAEQDQADVSTDPALALLYPVDPRQIDLASPQPAPPEHLAEQLAERARPAYAATDPRRRWSALLLGDLASRLPGLHASSPRYLRHQFLLRPGTIARDTQAVTIRLDPVPLGVVLRMAGHGSPPPRLPQLGGRLLILDLDDQRRGRRT